ncbi:HAMP domain-containing sensor histidine kinase [Flavobacterium sp. DG1-102-2]|uniref:sensor histidine kinase n=1 Tax=Flavobacterium sp. DG1-102-2 TaxID=3081663 RepID=UPI002949B903|nr:HAMP domain-containing sensor histidine kinase [Flavobacterium sp. DG1-102-2]MDV6170197.1 HAMP domain-containing sensor histidine kinase [Flavobacterium sp. DG1-102-2]
MKKIEGFPYPEDFFKNPTKNSYIPHPTVSFVIKGRASAFSSGGHTYIVNKNSIGLYDKNFKHEQQFGYKYKDSSQFFSLKGNLYLLGENNNYAICTSKGTFYKNFDIKTGKAPRIYSNAFAEQTFLYSGNKLYHIQNIDGKLKTRLIFEDFDCESSNIVSIYFDLQNEILFLGSTNKGLLVVKKKLFEHNATSYYHPSGTDDVYYAMEQYAPGSILTSTGEIFNKNGTSAIIDIGNYTDKYTLIIDKNGDVWTKEHAILSRFTKSSGFKQRKEWVFKNTISALAKGKDGSIYISVFNESGKKGGFLYNFKPWTPKVAPKKLMYLSAAASEIKDVNGNDLWAGSWNGLYKINLRKKSFKKIKQIGNVHVRNIYMPSSNELWACTYNKGYFLLKNGKVTKLPLDSKAYLQTAHCIIEDKSGYFWITTNKGIFQVKKQDLYDYADNKIKSIYYHIYDKDIGFKNNEFNGGCNPCGVYADKEIVFFPSMDGVVYFNPAYIENREPLNNIYTDEIRIDNKRYSVQDTLVFGRNFERIQFLLSSPFYGNPYNQNIEAKLEGPVEQDWAAIADNTASFSTLPPGDYIFTARKLGGFGSKYIYTTIHFYINPAFWQTKCFTVFLIIVILLLGYGTYVLRVRYIKHKNIQLEKQVILKTEQLYGTIAALRKTKDELSAQVTNHKNLVTTITHDIKSPLNFMAITGRYLFNNIDNPKKTAKEDIKAIYTSSQQLYNFVDQFLVYAKETDSNNDEPKPYSLYVLAQEKLAFFKNIASAEKTMLINSVDPNLKISINRHLLSIILHNLIDNAVKNTFDGKITTKASLSNGKLQINITDNGNGMDPEKAKYYQDLSTKALTAEKQNSIGLHIIINLLAIMDGALLIESSRGSGTSVTITFMQ